MTAARKLAEFAVNLRYEDIPPEVIERAKSCIIDTVGAAAFGAHLPWSQIIIAYAQRNSAPGGASIIGTKLKVRAPFASLANGSLAHAFEMDSLCQPSVGVHPGASLTAPCLATAQARGRTGRDLLTAFVAGFEVVYRIGDAARHSSEKMGFHAPGLTGVFAGAIGAGKLMDLDVERMTNALGVGGSLCSGLLEFSKSGGGMVKRLHLGRAAEGGFMAASLAREGYTGPHTVIDGKFGFLNVYARDIDPPRLLKGMGEEWHTLKSMFKRYACHITAHTPVTGAIALKATPGFSAADVASVTILGNEKMVSHHNILDPQDLAMAQYSTPFCVALSLFRDPSDPRNFNESALADPAIRDLCRRTTMGVLPEGPGVAQFSSRLILKMKDGRELTQDTNEFEGMPARPLTAQSLAAKFQRSTADVKEFVPARVLERLQNIEQATELGKLFD